jgi:uracil phosphoribosyltransferase
LLKGWGLNRIKFVGVIAAVPGLQRFTTAHPDVPLFLAAVDDELTESGYIVPGLGNAGDRQFGTG